MVLSTASKCCVVLPDDADEAEDVEERANELIFLIRRFLMA